MKTTAHENAAAPVLGCPPPKEFFSLNNILVPVDFSEASMEALQYVRALSAASGATIHAIYVQQPSAMIADLNGVPISTPPDCETATERGVALDKLLSKDAPRGIVYTTDSRIGYPVEVINSMAGETEADMIVITTHGRKGFSRLLFGSVTERVIREGRCPVLVLRPGQERYCEAPFRMKKVLLPIDLTEHSQQAIQYGVGLARKFGAEITLAHFIPRLGASEKEEISPAAIDEFRWTKETVEHWLEKALENREMENVATKCVALDGSILAELPEYVKKEGFDLIVCTTHGFGGLRHLLFGSIAEDVMRESPCPVLIIKTHEEEKEVRP